MEDWVNKLRETLKSDTVPRVALMAGTAVLAVVVLADAFGARDRAVAMRADGRMGLLEEGRLPVSVPSSYRVPRDLASEARRGVLDEAAEEAEAIAEVTEDQDDTDPMEMAEADMPEEDEAAVVEDERVDEEEAEVAEDDLVEEEVETEVAEDERAEEDEVEVAEDDMTEDAVETEVAEDERAEEDEIEVAEDEMTEDAVETEVAEDERVAEDEVEVAADDATEDDAIASLMASADLSNGQRVWRQCAACHVYDAEQNRGGPHLVNIIGREVAAADGWRYSSALQEHGGEWSVDSLLAWLENPDSYIPGNQMAFRGLRDEQDRIDVLGFLEDQRID